MNSPFYCFTFIVLTLIGDLEFRSRSHSLTSMTIVMYKIWCQSFSGSNNMIIWYFYWFLTFTEHDHITQYCFLMTCILQQFLCSKCPVRKVDSWTSPLVTTCKWVPCLQTTTCLDRLTLCLHAHLQIVPSCYHNWPHKHKRLYQIII